MIDKATIDQIHAAANIIEIIGDFVTLKKKGVNYQACCPFHNEKTPSFVVSPAKGYFKCFGCGEGGSAISFVMKHENISYVDALKYVARKYGIAIQERELTTEERQKQDARESMLTLNNFAYQYFIDKLHNSSEGRNIALGYFRERGFSDITIDKFGLGYCTLAGDDFSTSAIGAGYKEEYMVETGLTIKRERGGYYDRFCGRVMFPITSVSGRVIGFGGRTMQQDKKSAKYLNSPESAVYHKSDTLYGIFQAKKAIVTQNKAILVEGYTDVISMNQSGVENVVASSGTSLTKGQVHLLARFSKNVTVIYDGDSAGIKASLRGIDILLAEGLSVRIVELPEGEDPDSFAKSHTAEQLTEYIHNHEIDFLTFKTTLLLEGVKDDPLGRAEVVNEIIRTISLIPDAVVRSGYITQCATLMDYDQQVIKAEVNRLHGVLPASANKSKVHNNYSKQEDVSNSSQILQHVNQQGVELYNLERELVGYLLKYGDKNFMFQTEDGVVEVNVSEMIFDELEIDEIELKTPLFKKIYSLYYSLFDRETKAKVELNPFLDNDSSEISSYTVDLLLEDEKYRPSKIWSKLGDYIDEKDNELEQTIPKAIALYKQQVLNDLRNALCERVANEPENLEILRQLMVINNSYSALCKKYSRII